MSGPTGRSGTRGLKKSEYNFSRKLMEGIAVDIASNLQTESFNDESAPLLERNTLIWGSFLVGVVIGFVAVYIVVAQPLFAQLRDMQSQTVAMQGDLQRLVGVRNQAWEADNLLSDLNALKSQIPDARATIREIREMRKDLLEEARYTPAATGAVSELARLQNSILEQRHVTDSASNALEQLARIQARLVEEHADAPQAEDTLRDLERVRRDLAELTQLKQQLATGTQDLSAARTAASDLVTLKDQLIERSNNTELARTQVNRMFVLQDELASHGDEAQTAFDSLDKLVGIKDRLVDQTPQVADAVQTLEILSDFREEFDAQIRALARMREGLVEVVLLETTIGRVAKALEPLAQIANVRRLGDEELRAAAKTILDNRMTRLSSKPLPPRELPRTAENDSLRLPDDEPFLKDDLPLLGDDEPLSIPEPQSLPTTENETE